MLNAYNRVENFTNRVINDEYTESDNDTYIYGKYMESALGQISLLADTQTIKIANRFILDTPRNPKPLLISLRKELRSELGLLPIPDNDTSFNINTFRMFRKHVFQDTMTSEEQINLIIKLNELGDK